MKAKNLLVLGLAYVLAFALLTGCGSNTESVNENVQTENVQTENVQTEDGQTEEVQSEGAASEEFQMSDQPMMMKVQSIDGNQITASAMRGNFNKDQKPDMKKPDGEMPEMPEGEFPGKSDGEMPQKPEWEGKEGEFPERPEGDAPFRGEMESVTFTITDSTQITKQSESGTIDATADEITTDSMLQVQLNENNEALSITILSMSRTK